MSIINRIIKILEEKNIKEIELCKYIEIRTSTFSTWKQRGTDPPAKYIHSISVFCGVSDTYLLTGAEAQPLTEAQQKLLEISYIVPDTAIYEAIGELKAYAKMQEKETAKIS